MTGENNKDQKQNKEESEQPNEIADKTVAETKPTPAEPEKKSEATPSSKTPKKAVEKKSKSGLLLILLVIIIAAVAVSGFFGWQFWNQYSSKQEQRIRALESATAEQGSEVQKLSLQQKEKIESQKNLLAGITTSQEAIQQRLDTHTQRLRALAGTSRDDWLLAEARYLLRLASQRLLVERGTNGARALLESADGILLSVDDAGILLVRNAIANEIIALKLAKTVDRQGLYLQLAAIKNQIQSLPLVPFRPNTLEPDYSSNKVATPTEDAPWYVSVWQSITGAFSNLDRFIQIREHDDAPELLITEKQQLQTINQLMFLFEQAQFALLHEEEMIYRSSLEEAIKWWTHFYSHYDEFEIIRNELSKLQQTNIIQKLPDIHRSSELLTDYIDSFHKLNTPQKENTSEATKTKPQPKEAKKQSQTPETKPITQEPQL